MYLNEETAFTKDCPAFRFCVNTENVVHGDKAPIYIHERCKASACIAWRWGPPERETMIARHSDQGRSYYTRMTSDGRHRTLPDGSVWIYEHTDRDAEGEFDLLHRAPAQDAPRRGYCGLGGKPEE